MGLRKCRDAALRPQAALVAEAAAEVARDLREGKEVANRGGSIVERVRRWLGDHRDTFRLFSL